MRGLGGSAAGRRVRREKEGSSFWIRLPCEPPEAAPAAEPGARRASPAGDRSAQRILVVDDTATSRLVAVRILEMFGFAVNAANSGKIGDGKIFVTEVLQAIRIRTGETGDDAI